MCDVRLNNKLGRWGRKTKEKEKDGNIQNGRLWDKPTESNMRTQYA
jgi:hypothetical protein